MFSLQWLPVHITSCPSSFFGPYRVLERIGKVAYRLQLPDAATVHPVFHVSQLKLSLGSQSVSSQLPSDLFALQVPVRVLQRRWTEGTQPTEQVLVEWSHMPVSLATWESLEQLRQQFPRAPAWGQAAVQERGNVSNAAAPAADEDQAPELPVGDEEKEATPRPKRTARPNPRVRSAQNLNSD